jgi:excisionase family DNA binding protein
MPSPTASKTATSSKPEARPSSAAISKAALPRLFNVDDVAEQLGMCPKTVRRIIDRGEIRVHRFGRAIRVSEDDLATFIKLGRE